LVQMGANGAERLRGKFQMAGDKRKRSFSTKKGPPEEEEQVRHRSRARCQQISQGRTQRPSRTEVTWLQEPGIPRHWGRQHRLRTGICKFPAKTFPPPQHQPQPYFYCPYYSSIGFFGFPGGLCKHSLKSIASHHQDAPSGARKGARLSSTCPGRGSPVPSFWALSTSSPVLHRLTQGDQLDPAVPGCRPEVKGLLGISHWAIFWSFGAPTSLLKYPKEIFG
jgi:hypothetical protein